MKKRSLFAAVAMLLVSAVVLTSATFAWFQSNGTITPTQFSATTAANNAGLLLSPNGSTQWGTSVSLTQYVNSSSDTNIFYGGVSGTTAEWNIASAVLTPVSGAIGSSGVSFIGGSLSGTTFTGSGAAGSATDHSGGYLKYATYVKSPNAAGTIVVTPTFTTDVNPFTYFACYILDSANSVIASYYAANKMPDASTSTVTYDALTNTTNGWEVDAGDDYIVSTSEAGSGNYATTPSISLFNQTTAANTLRATVNANDVIKVVAYVWAEGQDPQCVPGAAATTGNVCELNFSLA